MDKNDFINIIVDLLKEGKTTEIQAHGISMFPLLLPGDKLKISPERTYAKGDIIVFKGKETLIAHRIISISNTKVICKGDSLFSTDPILSEQGILGKVIGRTRKNSYRSVNHWIFRFAKQLMPRLGKFPRVIIRYTAILYLKLTHHSI
ncbi:S24/S26 family peptidase [Carboxylicivirga caseinilyticus]|uniref:S24/S26 family peptidase n=1 Tax=Carboxylicivirga caseinilyticus TaxID=3417572 RepID=UPI003D3441C2|nr:S24/S26 family peptidase [Marinilabiliaceae bacterium A049]